MLKSLYLVNPLSPILMQKRIQTTTKRAKKVPVPKVTITGRGAFVNVGSATMLKKVACATTELTYKQPQGNQNEVDH